MEGPQANMSGCRRHITVNSSDGPFDRLRLKNFEEKCEEVLMLYP